MTRLTDIFAGVGLAALSAATIFWIIPEHTSPPQSDLSLAPAFMPNTSAVIVLVMAFLLVISGIIRKAEDEEVHEEFGMDASGIGFRELKDTLSWVIFSVTTILGFLVIGFIATGILMLVALMFFAGVRNWKVILITSVAVPITLQQIAWHAFTVQMP